MTADSPSRSEIYGSFPNLSARLDRMDELIDAGVPGTGDMSGPATSTAGNAAVFASGTGKVLEDAGFPPLSEAQIQALIDASPGGVPAGLFDPPVGVRLNGASLTITDGEFDFGDFGPQPEGARWWVVNSTQDGFYTADATGTHFVFDFDPIASEYVAWLAPVNFDATESVFGNLYMVSFNGVDPSANSILAGEIAARIAGDAGLAVDLSDEVTNRNDAIAIAVNGLATEVYAAAQAQAVQDDLDGRHLPVSVTSFGAVGDGVADDTEAFELALAQLTLGGTLWIPPGQYRVRRWLKLPTNVVARGFGDASQLLRPLAVEVPAVTGEILGGATSIELSDASGFAVGDAVSIFDPGNFEWDTTHAVITDITDDIITFTPETVSTYTDAIVNNMFPVITSDVNPDVGVQVRDLLIDGQMDESDAITSNVDFTNALVHLEGATRAVVSNVTLRNHSQDLYSDQGRAPLEEVIPSANLIEGCYLVNTRRHAVHLGSHIRGARVVGNTMQDVQGGGGVNDGYAVFLCANARGAAITGNTMVNCNAGVSGGDSRDIANSIVGNTFHGGALTEYWFAEVGPGTTVTGNTVRNGWGGVRVSPTKAGPGVEASEGCVISGNHLQMAGIGGRHISIGQDCDYSVVDSNMLSSIDGTGGRIYLELADYCSIRNNVLDGFTDGITIGYGSTGCVFEGNLIADKFGRAAGGHTGYYVIIGTHTDLSIDTRGVTTPDAPVKFATGGDAPTMVRLLVNGTGDNGATDPATGGDWDLDETDPLTSRFNGTRVLWNDGGQRLSEFYEDIGWLTLV